VRVQKSRRLQRRDFEGLVKTPLKSRKIPIDLETGPEKRRQEKPRGRKTEAPYWSPYPQTRVEFGIFLTTLGFGLTDRKHDYTFSFYHVHKEPICPQNPLYPDVYFHLRQVNLFNYSF